MTEADLLTLYREQVLGHAKSPFGRGEPESFDISAKGQNPLCGDSLTVFINENEDGEITVSFEGTGCAISVASASMMTEMISKLPRANVQALIDRVVTMLHDDPQSPVDKDLQSTPVAALSGVRTYPSRIKCAELAWQAVAAALAGESTTTTETNG
ncbi:MAG: Fe-S cluster assembly sulfur transfer protein SufU [Pseudomonadota bacterium]